MRIEPQVFSAHVELPCRLFCGPDSMLELAGIAVRIDPSSMVLSLPQNQGIAFPVLGDRVRLELQLPLNSDGPKGKYMAVRARVTHVEDMPDGSRRLGFSFRKVHFKDRADVPVPTPRKATANGWEM